MPKCLWPKVFVDQVLVASAVLALAAVAVPLWVIGVGWIGRLIR